MSTLKGWRALSALMVVSGLLGQVAVAVADCGGGTAVSADQSVMALPDHFEGPFRLALALETMFAEVRLDETATDRAVIFPFSEESSIPETIEVLVSQTYNEGPTIKHILVVARTMDYLDCHACGAPTRVAIFERHEGVWYRHLVSATFHVGEWGIAPDTIRLVPIGPQRYGLVILSEHNAQGSTSTTLRVLAESNEGFGELLKISEYSYVFRDFDDTEIVYARLSSHYSFVTSGRDYYDLRVERYGVGWREDPEPGGPFMRQYADLIVFHFDGELYMPGGTGASIP